LVEPVKKLRKICQSSAKGDCLYDRIFIRKVSIYFTKLFLYTPITGNQVTLLMILVGAVASVFFVFGNHYMSIIGALILQLWYVLDHVDGEVARYRGKSRIGVYLDLLNHSIVHPLIFVFMAFGVYSAVNNIWILILGFSSAISVLWFDLAILNKYAVFVMERMPHKKEKKPGAAKKGSLGFLQKTYAGIGFVFRFPGMMNILLLASVFNVLMYIFIFYGISLPVIALVNMVYEYKIGFKRISNVE